MQKDRKKERKLSTQTVNLPHQKPTENIENILAQHCLQPTSSQPVQTRKHDQDHYEKVMEMDWACDPQRAGLHHPTALHWTPDGKHKRGRPKNT